MTQIIGEPKPAPAAFAIGTTQTPSGKTKVLLTVLAGEWFQNSYILNPEQAEAIGAQLIETAKLVRSGIVMVPGAPA
jgi:hypothetical protein